MSPSIQLHCVRLNFGLNSILWHPCSFGANEKLKTWKETAHFFCTNFLTDRKCFFKQFILTSNYETENVIWTKYMENLWTMFIAIYVASSFDLCLNIWSMSQIDIYLVRFGYLWSGLLFSIRIAWKPARSRLNPCWSATWDRFSNINNRGTPQKEWRN